jgi:hypothetical protein
MEKSPPRSYKNSKKLKTKTIQERKKRKEKAQRNHHQSIFEHNKS